MCIYIYSCYFIKRNLVENYVSKKLGKIFLIDNFNKEILLHFYLLHGSENCSCMHENSMLNKVKTLKCFKNTGTDHNTL